MPTREQITDTTSPEQVLADAVERALGVVPKLYAAREILDALVGLDDEPGPLDRYEIRAYVPETGRDPLVAWYCPRDHTDADAAGTLGIIARDFDGDQTGLTLGEILGAVLRHEREEHGQ
jgi:hypothetical protein